MEIILAQGPSRADGLPGPVPSLDPQIEQMASQMSMARSSSRASNSSDSSDSSGGRKKRRKEKKRRDKGPGLIRGLMGQGGDQQYRLFVVCM